MRVLVLVVACVGMAAAKVFTKCELATVLETTHKMTRDEVKNWVCIAQYESTFNSSAINHFNWDGSQDYGLFQLNNKYWCDSHYGKNECQIACSALLDANLTDDMKCIKKIIRDTEKWKGSGTGLTAWVAYVNKCLNKNLDQYMAECWTGSTSSNIIELKQESAGTPNAPPRKIETPNTQTTPEAEHLPIVNNARVPIVPIRYKVVMHPSYTYFPVQPPLFLANPYSFFYHRNY